MKRSQLIIMIILITISLGVNSWILGQELQINAKNQSPIKSIQYEDHSPILIDGNANFIAATTIEGWPGEGTPSSPYVIDGINITGPEDIHLIEIRNTDVYFQITNCSLTGGKRGIIFDNVKHSEISNNTVFNNGKHPTGHGIYLQNSGNITLVNNTVTNNPTYGVYLQNSENITLLKNTIINNGWLAGMAAGHGIYLRDSVNINLSTNLIINNGVNGIYLQNSGNNMISDNILVNDSLFLSGDLDDWLQAVVTNNSVNGKPLVYWQNVNGGTVPSNAGQVILVNSNSVEVAGQKLLGVQGAYCSNLSIRRNNISDSYRGIDLTSTNNSSLAGNNITYCSGGIFLMNSNNNILSNNTITNNGIANFWGFSDNNTLSSNFVDNNGDYGIRIYSSGNSTLFNNTFTNNDRWGINIDSSENSTLSNNLVVNNRGKSTWYQSYGGISIYRSGNNSLSDNNVSNNEGFGISSSGVISFSGNNVTKNGDFGVSITGAGSCSVINNRVLNNNGDGIRIGGAGSISVINNAAENNGGSGIRISGAGSSSIDKNLITNNHGLGIALSSSGNNNIRNNTLWNNTLHVSGSLEECLQAIVTNNSVNGKPLMYQQNNTGGTILDGSSQIILVNSNSIEVSDQNLMGVQGAFCSNLSIHNNNFSKGYYGIALEATVNSTLSNNTITDNSLHGIYLRESDNNNLEN
ncbi:MAG: right-handed parallel beta-helix repeat-containing protein, partial [Candidatus Hodarchaeota archaeon]